MTSNSHRKWHYKWYHKPTGKFGTKVTLAEMTPLEFLSAIAWWNTDEWIYIPVTEGNYPPILPPHKCQNTDNIS